MYRKAWVGWDAKVREDLVQRAAELCLNRMLRPKRGRAGTEASLSALPLTTAWMLQPNQGRDTVGKVLGEMRVSTTKKQVLQSRAGAFPCNAVLHKWGIAPSPACALCGHPAETQSRVKCSESCPVIKEARIRTHHKIHNLAQRLWKGIRDAAKGWIITTEQTVAGLQGLPLDGIGWANGLCRFFLPLTSQSSIAESQIIVESHSSPCLAKQHLSPSPPPVLRSPVKG
jgi:hypothetical protein